MTQSVVFCYCSTKWTKTASILSLLTCAAHTSSSHLFKLFLPSHLAKPLFNPRFGFTLRLNTETVIVFVFDFSLLPFKPGWSLTSIILVPWVWSSLIVAQVIVTIKYACSFGLLQELVENLNKILLIQQEQTRNKGIEVLQGILVIEVFSATAINSPVYSFLVTFGLQMFI